MPFSLAPCTLHPDIDIPASHERSRRLVSLRLIDAEIAERPFVNGNKLPLPWRCVKAWNRRFGFFRDKGMGNCSAPEGHPREREPETVKKRAIPSKKWRLVYLWKIKA